MMNFARCFSVVAIAAIVVPGAVRAADEAPAKAVESMAASMEKHDLVAVWKMLPASYQADVNDLIGQLGDKMDPELWNRVFGLVKKAAKMLKDQKQFIVENPFMAMAEEQIDTEALAEDWDEIVGILEAVANSDLADVSKLKSFEMESFLNTTGKDVAMKVSTVMNMIKDPSIQGQVAGLKDVSAETISSEGDTATVKVTAGEQTMEVEMVKIDDAWVPKQLVDQWSEMVGQAKDAIGGVTADDIAQAKEMVMPILDQVEQVVDQLGNAQTEEEFMEAIQAVMEVLPL